MWQYGDDWSIRWQRMIKHSKALLEVWDWKEKIFEERKGRSISEWAALSKKNSQELLKKYNIKKSTRKVDTTSLPKIASGY
jgi:hypothetical protein